MTATITAPLPLLALRPYQADALAALLAAPARGVTRPLAALPTGSGKTVVFCHLIQRRGGRALVLVHRDELLQQAADKLLMLDPSLALGLGVVKAEADAVDARIVLASVQTLSRPERLRRLPPDFATVVVDEAHHAAAASYRRILAHVGAFAADGPLVAGFTATPDRGDGVGLDAVFQKIVAAKTLVEMIAAGYLCDLRAVQVRLDADFGALHTRAGDLVEAELAAALLAANAPQHVAAAYRDHAADRRGLIFTPTVTVAHAMAEALGAAGIPTEAVDGGTPPDARRAILRRLHTGETQAVANCAVLTEGFDEPAVDCIVVARPTKSRPFYAQMVGRGTRLYPGKQDCLILDTVGAVTRHDLVSVASLAGLPLDALATGATLAEAASVAAAVADPFGAVDGKLVVRHVALFRDRHARWIASGASRFVLPTGQGRIVLDLDPADDTWRVVEHRPGQAPTALAAGLDLGYAQGLAEDRMRALGAARLVDPRARWRAAPASEKQIAALRRWRVRVPPGLTKGDASDLITAAMDRRGAA